MVHRAHVRLDVVDTYVLGQVSRATRAAVKDSGLFLFAARELSQVGPFNQPASLSLEHIWDNCVHQSSAEKTASARRALFAASCPTCFRRS